MVDSLRPSEEISAVVQQACEIRTDSPADEYDAKRKIGHGGFGEVFIVERKTD